jgi:hypothetical protein
MTIGAVEFLRRFLQHVLPPGFVKIRHFGWLANRCRKGRSCGPASHPTCGPFEINMAEAELRRHGIRLKLQEKPFQLLAKLLERPGTVVSREELREKLWTDDTYVDFERSLNVAMSKLRAALVLACCGLSGDAALEKNFHRHETDLEKVRELFAREQRFWEVTTGFTQPFQEAGFGSTNRIRRKLRRQE